MRRRRRLPETYTLVECRHCINVATNATCTGPRIDVFPLLAMSTHRTNAGSDPVELTTAADKFIVVDGIKFQSEMHSDPNDWQQCNPLSPPDIHQLTFFLTIWEAIMVLPLAQGAETPPIPAYVPNLTDALQQFGDIADRVLWKRLTVMPLWGTAATGGVSQLEATMRDFGHGPVVVKSRAKLDDRHALFMVRNYVHNLVFSIGGAPPCSLDCDASDAEKNIPILHDEWFKIFYHTRK